MCIVMARPLVRRAPRGAGTRLSLWGFAASAVFLLTMSGVFHLLPRGSVERAVFQRLDHAGIFILIAGTVTAGHSLFFRGVWRWGMIVAIWILGISGLVAKVVFFRQISEGVGLVLYLAMGWLGAIAMLKLAFERGWYAAAHLFAGGLVYTAGAVGEFVEGDRLTVIPGVLGAHELFHLAVLAALAIHWRLFHQAAALKGEPVVESNLVEALAVRLPSAEGEHPSTRAPRIA